MVGEIKVACSVLGQIPALHFVEIGVLSTKVISTVIKAKKGNKYSTVNIL